MTPPDSEDALLTEAFAADVPPPPVPLRLEEPKKRRVNVIREKKYYPSITVKTENGNRLRVPTTADAAKCKMQVTLAKIAQVFDQNTQFILDHKIAMDPKALGDYVQAGVRLSELSKASYEGTEVPGAGAAKSEVGRLAAEMLGSAMQGAAKGISSSMEERFAKIAQLGKAQRREIVVSGERMQEEAQKNKEPLPHE